jgi:hypothetical protein
MNAHGDNPASLNEIGIRLTNNRAYSDVPNIRQPPRTDREPGGRIDILLAMILLMLSSRLANFSSV